MERDLLNLPDEVRSRLAVDALTTCGAAQVVRGINGMELHEVRRRPIELRASGDGTISIGGYATVFEVAYDVAGGPPYGWVETIARGATTKALNERDDVRLLINHDGLPLARTKAKTMSLTADDIGLLTDAPGLDLKNPKVQELNSVLERHDADEMSFAFQTIRQEWNDDYTERRILEVRLFDVSVVTYPANPATTVALRAAPPKIGMPLALAQRQAETARLASV